MFSAPATFLEGKRVAFTGASPFPKDQITALLEAFGGKVSQAVSKNIDILVLMHDKFDSAGKDIKLGSKYERASKLIADGGADGKLKIMGVEDLFREARESAKTETEIKEVELVVEG